MTSYELRKAARGPMRMIHCPGCDKDKPYRAKGLCVNCIQVAYRAANREKINARERAYRASYRAANRERVREHQRAYRAANREKISQRTRAYRAANRERALEYEQAYRAANREKVSQHARAYQAAHPERVRESKRAYYAANRENCNQHSRTWSAANREKTNERNRINRRFHGQLPRHKLRGHLHGGWQGGRIVFCRVCNTRIWRSPRCLRKNKYGFYCKEHGHLWRLFKKEMENGSSQVRSSVA